jgi:hypothetical protein
MMPTSAALCFLLTLAVNNGGKAPAPRTEVIVMGMIHGTHRTSEMYSISRIRELVTAVGPDQILCEIPPGHLAPALEQYRKTQEITESRVKVFPEYVDAIIPLQAETAADGGGFEMVPCAGWTRAMADARRARLKELKTERADDYAEMSAAQEGVGPCLEAEGKDEDPFFIDSAAYDACVKKGMEPYDRHFNQELGAGGWTNINQAHWDLIAKALDAQKGKGKRMLITFGAWHAYWFKEQLALRDDVRVISLQEASKPSN